MRPRDDKGRYIPTGTTPEERRVRRYRYDREYRQRKVAYQTRRLLMRAAREAGIPSPELYALRLMRVMEEQELKLIRAGRIKRGRVAA